MAAAAAAAATRNRRRESERSLITDIKFDVGGGAAESRKVSRKIGL